MTEKCTRLITQEYKNVTFLELPIILFEVEREEGRFEKQEYYAVAKINFIKILSKYDMLPHLKQLSKEHNFIFSG